MNADWSEIKISTSLSNSLLEYPPREGGIAGDTIIPDEKSRNKAILLLRQKKKKLHVRDPKVIYFLRIKIQNIFYQHHFTNRIFRFTSIN
jgi:hypothetical protein